MSENKAKIIWGAAAGIGAIATTMISGVLDREGGYVNHPNDRGGETNLGVTVGTARQAGYTGNMKVFPKACETEKHVCAEKIYYITYIEKPGLVPIIKLSPAVADEMFDTGVNMGPARPGPWLQQGLNTLCPNLPGHSPLKADGQLGAKTVAYFEACQAKLTKPTFCTKMVTLLDDLQLQRYMDIVRKSPSQKVFMKGWTNHRIGNVKLSRCALEK